MKRMKALPRSSRHAGVRSRRVLIANDAQRVGDHASVEDRRVTTTELLAAWREATRAAEEAAEHARLVEEAADKADTDAVAVAEIAELARKAVEAAQRAAERAQAAADRARAFAAYQRNPIVGDARHTEEDARAAEAEAREHYHEAETEARRRLAEDAADRR